MIAEWNVLDRLQSGIDLKTNAAEGWNRFLNHSCRETHPSLLRLIKFLQTVQQNNETLLDRIISFRLPVSATKRKYLEKMNKLKRIVVGKDELPLLMFLRAITLNYGWKCE